MKQNKIYFFIFTAIFYFSFLTSCKDPANPKALVSIISENGKPVENAQVVLIPNDPPVVLYLVNDEGVPYEKADSDTLYTNSAGEVEWEYLYEAIINVRVNKAKDREFPFQRIGKGVVIFKPDSTYHETITIKNI